MASRRSLEKRIAAAERAVGAARKRLIALRRCRATFKDFAFRDSRGRRVRLSALFGRKKDLILVHNMGTGCPYCTMWADGFQGLLPHLEDRAAFVVVSNDPPAVQRRFARSRGWTFRMVSSHGTNFAEDSGFTDGKGNPWPGVSTFRRTPAGRIVRVAKDSFGPGDDYCSAWHLFDLLEGGVGEWRARLRYPR